MIISNSTQSSVQYSISSAPKSIITPPDMPGEQSETVLISPEASKTVTIMSDVTQSYNVNDSSQKERAKMAKELMNAGAINSGFGMHLIAPTSMHEQPNDRSNFLANNVALSNSLNSHFLLFLTLQLIIHIFNL